VEFCDIGDDMLRILTEIPRAVGWCVLCFAPVVLAAAWFGLYVGSERTETNADGIKDGRIAGLGKIVTVYCNYLTFEGLRTSAVSDMISANNASNDFSCPWRFARPFVFTRSRGS
jgi:hypothetical protein